MEDTRPSDRDLEDAGGRPVPHLVVSFLADDPLAAPSRHRLIGTKLVSLGRADSVSVDRSPERIVLGLPDAWLSSHHAALRPVLHRWAIEDLGSRNGTFVNGARVRELMLADGDVIELGHSFLVFRLAPPDAGPEDLTATAFDDGPPGLTTLSPSLARKFEQLRRVASSLQSVVIGGETGTGKEMVARSVHALSGRTGDFVAVNCGALPEALAEAELFGHRRGAFSGAVAERTGYVRAADGGTLFLDEIADLRLPSQAALLRVLQERQVVPLGAERPIAVDVRVCAATHEALAECVAAGRFRADLLARLRGFELELPPLRERPEDLGLIVRALLRRRGEAATFKAAAVRQLFTYTWPHNVRELEQVLGSALALASGNPIDRAHLALATAPSASRRAATGRGRPLRADELAHRDQLIQLLREHGGNIAAVCRAIGKGRQQIHRWLKRYDLDAESFRSS